MANEACLADQNRTILICPNEQRHHSDNKLFRNPREHRLSKFTDEQVLGLFEDAAEAFGLPHDLPVPPYGLPGFWDKPVNRDVMGIIRQGARYLLAAAKGEKRSLWNIHDEIEEQFRRAYDKGRADCLKDIDRRVAEQAEAYYQQKEAEERRAKVYFIRGHAGPVKIGKARSPEKRLKSLQTSHHEKLSILATCSGGARVEAEYHARFAAYRLHGEWFEPHPDILAEIERLRTVPNHTPPACKGAAA